ncbi:MAG: hypothetical protein WCJ03_03190 [Bacteroidales bacterium]
MSRIIEFPETWEELTQKQANFIFKKIYANVITQRWDEDSFRLYVADYLLGRKYFARNEKQIQYRLLVRSLADSLTWMFAKAEDGTLNINYDTLHNHFPKVGKMVVANIQDIRFGEYRHAVAIYHAYNESLGDASLLATFVGMLYRPAKEPFDSNKMQLYEKRGKKVPGHIAYYIYLWFTTLNRYLLTETFTIDGCDVCFSTIFKSDGEPSKGQDIGLNSILFTLADTGTFGNADQTDKAPLFRVMLKLLHDKNNADQLNN